MIEREERDATSKPKLHIFLNIERTENPNSKRSSRTEAHRATPPVSPSPSLLLPLCRRPHVPVILVAASQDEGGQVRQGTEAVLNLRRRNRNGRVRRNPSRP